MDNDALLCNCTFWPPRNRLPRGDWLGGWGRPRSSGRSWRWPPRRGWRECPAAQASGGQSRGWLVTSTRPTWCTRTGTVWGTACPQRTGQSFSFLSISDSDPHYKCICYLNIYFWWLIILHTICICISNVLCSIWFYSTHILKVCLNVAGQHCRFKVPYGQRLSFLHLQ